jgi:acetyl esterase/lipase
VNVPTELRAMLDAALAVPTPPLPAPWPGAGQSRESWLATIAQLRADHYDVAVRRSALLAPARAAPPVEVGAVFEVEEPSVVVHLPTGPGPHPVVVNIHGGGWWLGGGPEGREAAAEGCRAMCAMLGAAVVFVDYRPAPEHRAAELQEDCFDALGWTAQQDWADPDRIVVTGASAGANLAVGTALLARDRQGPVIRLLQLLVPATDATLSSASSHELATGFDITREIMVNAWQCYLGPDGDPTDPLASPLHAPDLAGLPATHVVTAEFDPLRDEGLALADRLVAHGVPVVHERFAMSHALATPDVGSRYVSAVLAALGQGLSTGK